MGKKEDFPDSQQPVPEWHPQYNRRNLLGKSLGRMIEDEIGNLMSPKKK